jgi:hypothetical protein
MKGAINIVAAAGGSIRATATEIADETPVHPLNPIPVFLGTTTVNVTAGTPTNAVVSLGTAVPASGANVGAVLVHAYNPGCTAISLTDSAAQTWTRHPDSRISGPPILTAITSATKAMTTTSTITVGFTNPGSGTQGVASAWYIPYVSGFGTLVNVGSSGPVPNAPTISTGTPTTSSVAVAVTLPTSGPALDDGVVQVQSRVTGTTAWSTTGAQPSSYCTPTVGSVTDAFNNTWTVVASGGGQTNAIMVNNSFSNGWDANMLLRIGGTLYHINSAPTWYTYTPTGALSSGSGVSWTAIGGTSPLISPGVTISGLSSGTNYDVSSYVSNTAGNGALSAVSPITTAGTAPSNVPGPPTALSSPSQTSNTVTLSWSPPTSGGALNTGAYQVSYRTGANPFVNWPAIPYCTPTVGSFNDGSNTWAIAASGVNAGTTYTNVITVNGVFAFPTQNVVIMLFINGVVWQLNQAGLWYSYAPVGQIVDPSNLPWSSGSTTSPLTNVVISGLSSSSTYNFQVTVSNTSGTGTAATTNATTSSATSGTGPAASGTFTAEFGSPTGVSILPQLWGVSMAGTAWNENYNTPAWVSAVTPLNFQFVRQHIEGLFQSIFSTYNAAPNWSAIAPWVNGFKNVFPNAVLQVGGAWLPNYLNGGNGNWVTANQTDTNWVVSMWTQLIAHLVAAGITVSYVDGVFNEPDIQGLYNISNTTISTGVVASVSAAVFNALAPLYPNLKFTGPCTAWYNPGYINALRNAYPGLAYTSFHFYNPNGYNNGVPNWNSLINDRTWTTEGNGTIPANAPGLCNEYGLTLGSGFSGDPANGTQTASVWYAVQGMVAGTLNNTPIQGIWQVSPDGGFQVVDQNGTIHPSAYMLSRAGQFVSGTAVSCTITGSVYTLACKRGSSSFGVMLANYSGASVSGTVAFSHWPVNSSGNGTVNMWQQTSSNAAGSTTPVTVATGVTSTITLPSMSVTVLYV